ncbi:isochorismatase family cysteine hydrolase [Cytophagaceae bacterium YF14B1]|uniref:Isochorismatase family cysteine hydrolase n=1 Tax=Xanthocytophaga flava TaxID=3048013 RepID=A0AAE3QX83_9BACT|nr:isochorismatase family cysteine hydrolase [Xanthocytophaga flavus]MDJ1484871.1 isochorismatase family cysteine hydrolase [Xanthocytophaga flavus]
MKKPEKKKKTQNPVPDQSPVVLLLIDLISDFTFPDAEQIFDDYAHIVPNIAKLKKRAKEAGIPVIYINDNFGKWQSDFHSLVDHCLKDSVKSQHLVKQIKPQQDDYTVLKPKHSAFYCTTLDVLLEYLKAETLIIAGIAGNICVLFTANDAYMRDYKLVIPADCTASNSVADNTYTLTQMEKVLKANIQPSTELNLEELKKES